MISRPPLISALLLCLLALGVGTTLSGDGYAQNAPPAVEAPPEPAPPELVPGSDGPDVVGLSGNPPPASNAGPDTGAGRQRPTLYRTSKTPYEYYLAGITVALGVLMAGLVCLLSFKRELNGEIVRSFLLVVIVFSALFLIVAGYSEKQTAPVFGLLGTILGYMFGRTVSVEVAKEEAKAVPAVVPAVTETDKPRSSRQRGRNRQ